MTKYLIIGNSAGGIAAAEAIREIDSQGLLAIVSDEHLLAYSRPLISEYLAGEKTLPEMALRNVGFYKEHKIALHLGKKVIKIDTEAHTATLEDYSTLDWDRLLLACGGKPVVPHINGTDRKGVITFTTLADARRIKESLEWARRIVVIGGGLIGMSVTDALIKKGIEVIVVELMDRVLSAMLDKEASEIVQEKLRESRVRVITGHQVTGITGRPGNDDILGGIVLDNGEEISCYLVIIAIGVTPRTELVTGTGIKVNRGILVDRNMRTSHPDVYACGDVTEAFDSVYGSDRLTPIWPNASIGGRVAGLNMAGVPAVYPPVTSLATLKYFGLSMVSAGIVEPPKNDGFEILERHNGNNYRKLVLKEGRIAGMVLNGDISRAGILYGLMREKLPVTDYKNTLLEETFDWAALPPALRAERLGKELNLTKG